MVEFFDFIFKSTLENRLIEVSTSGGKLIASLRVWYIIIEEDSANIDEREKKLDNWRRSSPEVLNLREGNDQMVTDFLNNGEGIFLSWQKW